MAELDQNADYKSQVADSICDRLSSGESLVQICETEGFPDQRTIFRWLAKDEVFRQNYARARSYWAEAEFERLMQIADTPQEGVKTRTTKDGLEVTTGDMIDHRRLQVDTRKWALARMFPKKYGDATMLKHADHEGNAMHVKVTRVKGRED
jgi:hypothetical protein